MDLRIRTQKKTNSEGYQTNLKKLLSHPIKPPNSTNNFAPKMKFVDQNQAFRNQLIELPKSTEVFLKFPKKPSKKSNKKHL